MRPERILADLRKFTADEHAVTDVGWNKNGVTHFPFTCRAPSYPGRALHHGYGPPAPLA